MTPFLSLVFVFFYSDGNKLTFLNKLGTLLGSVGHRAKIHNITPVTGKERGDLDFRDYVVMQKPQPQANRLPPHTLIMDYTRGA